MYAHEAVSVRRDLDGEDIAAGEPTFGGASQSTPGIIQNKKESSIDPCAGDHLSDSGDAIHLRSATLRANQNLDDSISNVQAQHNHTIELIAEVNQLKGRCSGLQVDLDQRSDDNQKIRDKCADLVRKCEVLQEMCDLRAGIIEKKDEELEARDSLAARLNEDVRCAEQAQAAAEETAQLYTRRLHQATCELRKRETSAAGECHLCTRFDPLLIFHSLQACKQERDDLHSQCAELSRRAKDWYSFVQGQSVVGSLKTEGCVLTAQIDSHQRIGRKLAAMSDYETELGTAAPSLPSSAREVDTAPTYSTHGTAGFTAQNAAHRGHREIHPNLIVRDPRKRGRVKETAVATSSDAEPSGKKAKGGKRKSVGGSRFDL